MSLWGDIRIPIILVSGEVNSGKTLFGLTIDPNCRKPSTEIEPTTIVWDQEGSADSYVGALNFVHKDTRAAVAAGIHQQVVTPADKDPRWLQILKRNADVNDSPSASMFRAWYLSLIQVPPGKYAVGFCDTFTPIQDGMVDWLKRHPEAFGRTYAEYTKASSMFLWPDVKAMLSHILAVDCRLRFETFIMSVHLKNEWSGQQKTGKRIAEGLDVLEKLATLHLELDRTPEIKGKEAPRVPAAILKKERLVRFGVTADDDKPILPPRLPKATPDAIRQYILNPPDFGKLSTAERLPDQSLSADQKLLIEQETARLQAEAATAKLSALEMAREVARQGAAGQPLQQPSQPQLNQPIQPETATAEQQQAIIALMRQIFPNGAAAAEWLRNGYQTDSLHALSVDNAISARAALDTMLMALKAEKAEAEQQAQQQSSQVQQPQTSEPTLPLETTETGQTAITAEQREAIKLLMTKLYEDNCRAEQEAWLRSLGYSAIRSVTYDQANARIRELEEQAAAVPF